MDSISLGFGFGAVMSSDMLGKTIPFTAIRAEREKAAETLHGGSRLKAQRVTVTKRSTEEGVGPGAVIALQDRSELMTVEAVRQDTFGLVLDCVWFDAEDCLRFRRFPLKNIDWFPRQESTKRLQKGMEVRLRSRGPVMSVSRIMTKAGATLVECVWSGVMGRERRRAFPVDCLVLTIMERFELGDGRSL